MLSYSNNKLLNLTLKSLKSNTTLCFLGIAPNINMINSNFMNLKKIFPVILIYKTKSSFYSSILQLQDRVLAIILTVLLRYYNQH